MLSSLIYRTSLWKRSWVGAFVFAGVLHLGIWWLPVAFPALQVQRPRIVRLRFVKVPPPVRPPEIRKPEIRERVKPPPPRRIRRKRVRRKRVRPRRVRRKRQVPRRPPPKLAQPTPRAVRKVATQAPLPLPTPVAPAPTRVAPRAVVAPTPAPRVNMRGYGMAVYEAIQRQKRYPLMAYKMRFEGLVILSIRIAKSGRLLGQPRVVRSSGHSLLDEEAIRMVLAAAPLQPIPVGYRRRYATFRVPVQFRIQN